MRLKVKLHGFGAGIEILVCCDKYVLMNDAITLITDGLRATSPEGQGIKAPSPTSQATR